MALIATGGGVGAITGAGGQSPGRNTNRNTDKVITAQWDGPTTHLNWLGDRYTTAEATFVGDRVAIPGDRVQRTLNVCNDGPSGAVMVVSLLVAENPAAFEQDPELASDVDLFWSVGDAVGSDRFETLLAAADGTEVAHTHAPRGVIIPVTVGFTMDRAVTTGQDRAAAMPELSFKVEVRMHGDASLPSGMDSPHDSDAPSAARPDTNGWRIPGLSATGAAVLGAAAAAVGLLGLGALALLLVTRRRRRARHASSE
ncbi:MAG: hypothetical protein FWD74_00105 [Actinomycetia bacterium]|nr:hypothetical protein [Actinomycetes bacterium]